MKIYKDLHSTPTKGIVFLVQFETHCYTITQKGKLEIGPRKLNDPLESKWALLEAVPTMIKPIVEMLQKTESNKPSQNHDQIMAASSTVKGYEAKVNGFNEIARCYIGFVKDPIRDNQKTTCSWDKFGKCKNANRPDCNLKLY